MTAFAKVQYHEHWSSNKYEVVVDSAYKLYKFLRNRCGLNYDINSIKQTMEELKFPTVFSTEVDDNGGDVYITYYNEKKDDVKLNTVCKLKKSELNLWYIMNKKYEQQKINKELDDGDVIEEEHNEEHNEDNKEHNEEHNEDNSE